MDLSEQPITKISRTNQYITPDSLDLIRRQQLALPVQRDPYDYMMTEWDGYMAK